MAEMFKFAIMSPLAMRVKQLGVCPNCHKKTLEGKYNDGFYLADQCSRCGHVYLGAVSAEQPPTPGGKPP